MRYFDYQSIADEAGMSAEDLERLCRLVRKEFPYDDMMYELHVMGACRAVRDGPYTLKQVIDGYAPAPAAEPTAGAGHGATGRAMRYAVVIEGADGSYSAYIPDLPGCIATAGTREDAHREIGRAIRLHLERLKEGGAQIPEPTSTCEYLEVK